MPELTIVAPASITGGDTSSKGPKYNEDVTALEEGLKDDELEDQDEDKLPLISTDDKDEDDEGKDDIDEELETKEIEKPQIPFDRPTIKDIKTKYPDFFKDFPEMKEGYFREIEFTKLFPTIEDAQEAFTDNEAFTTLSDAVLSGDPAPLFDSVEKTDPKAYELLTLSFLPALYKKSQELYTQAVTPLFENLLRTLYKDKDENTRNAALVVAEYLFGTDGENISKGTKSLAKNIQPTEEQKKIKEQKESSLSTQFMKSVGKVEGDVRRSLESLALKNPVFDPDKVFSPFLRKQGAQEVVKRVMSALSSDKGHMTVMAARWKRARANGYSSDDESKLISTYLARAKSLIPDACSKVSAAMLGTSKKAAEKRDERTRVAPRENNSGRPGGSNGRSLPEKVDYNKMSDMDILSS